MNASKHNSFSQTFLERNQELNRLSCWICKVIIFVVTLIANWQIGKLIQSCANKIIIASGDLRLNLMFVYVYVLGVRGGGVEEGRQTIIINQCRKHFFSLLQVPMILHVFTAFIWFAHTSGWVMSCMETCSLIFLLNAYRWRVCIGEFKRSKLMQEKFFKEIYLFIFLS